MVIVRQAKNTTESEVDEAVAVCLKAFPDHPGTRAYTGGNEDLEAPLFRSMIRAGLLMGDVYFAVDESGQILAIAIWSPPGDTLFSSEEQRALGVNDLFARLSEEAKDWWKAVLGGTITNICDDILGPTGRKDGWWAHTVAVHPDFHGQGIAKQLFEVIVKKAASTNTRIALFCTNEHIEMIYHRLNLHTLDRNEVPDGLGGSFPVILMSNMTDNLMHSTNSSE